MDVVIDSMVYGCMNSNINHTNAQCSHPGDGRRSGWIDGRMEKWVDTDDQWMEKWIMYICMYV